MYPGGGNDCGLHPATSHAGQKNSTPRLTRDLSKSTSTWPSPLLQITHKPKSLFYLPPNNAHHVSPSSAPNSSGQIVISAPLAPGLVLQLHLLAASLHRHTFSSPTSHLSLDPNTAPVHDAQISAPRPRPLRPEALLKPILPRPHRRFAQTLAQGYYAASMMERGLVRGEDQDLFEHVRTPHTRDP